MDGRGSRILDPHYRVAEPRGGRAAQARVQAEPGHEE